MGVYIYGLQNKKCNAIIAKTNKTVEVYAMEYLCNASDNNTSPWDSPTRKRIAKGCEKKIFKAEDRFMNLNPQYVVHSGLQNGSFVYKPNSGTWNDCYDFNGEAVGFLKQEGDTFIITPELQEGEVLFVIENGKVVSKKYEII